MSKSDLEFLARLRATFRVEAAEHLQTVATGLIAIEKSADAGARQPLVEQVFRAAHSLKGAARAVDFTDIETACQDLESRFAAWKRQEVAVDAAELDAAHRSLDVMTAALALPAAASAAPASAVAATRESTTPSPDNIAGDGETVRVAVRTLDEHLLGAEELLTAKIAARQRAADLETLAASFEEWREKWSRAQTQAQAGALRAADAELAGFFEWNHDWMRALESRVQALRRAAGQDRLQVEKLVDDLLENSKRLLMLPLSTLSGLFAKVVRDLARELDKEANLEMRGGEVCIDKRILEEVKDPLVHLLRNCIDHGIEPPAVRAAAGKPPRATITLDVAQVNGNQVQISISDDGAGIDVAAVKARAIERGLISPEAAAGLDEAAAQALVFETGLSTSPMLTQLSGRGLGLAIVREKAQKLGGRVTLESRRGAGSTLRMVLPLTLATFRGVLVRAARRTFVVPTAHVERVTSFRDTDVRTVEGRETLTHEGRALALTRLAEVLDLPAVPQPAQARATAALIVGAGAERIAFAVDEVIDEREVLVKRLGRPLVRVRNLAGATVLGSGEVAPILNVVDLLESARRQGPLVRAAAPLPAAQVTCRVLVAEDSITSRMLLKGILESAGYEVKTAVDGMEALTLLRSEKFNVLVSDVEMPRLNGFDLTARVRADRTLGELPVILVTALASREDRERGIDVGANAYLVKSDLDQSDLLEALRRLA